MISVGVITVIVVLFFGLSGVTIWYFNRRSKFRFSFRVWSKDLISSRVVKARITVDKENKNKRSFTFKDNPSILVMRDPSHWSNGRSERWVLADESGEYQYINPVGKLLTYKDQVLENGEMNTKIKPVDDVLYLQTRLKPTNKMLALEQMRNNQKRYDGANGAVAAVVFGAIMLGILIAVGNIYATGTMIKHSDVINDNVNVMKDIQEGYSSFMIDFSEVMETTTLNLGYIYGQINEGVNITRPVDGYRP